MAKKRPKKQNPKTESQDKNKKHHLYFERHMESAIQILNVLGPAILAVALFLYASLDKSIGIWVFFGAVVSITLLCCLYWQKHIWEEEAKAAPQLKKDGLTFREVPPKELSLPDIFTIDYGGNTRTIKREDIAKQFPFSKLSGMVTEGQIPLRIYFNSTGDMKVDCTVYDEDGSVAAKIMGNDFSLINGQWDRNWDSTGFEIINGNGIPFFQIDRPRPNLIKIRGMFITSLGVKLSATDAGVQSRRKDPENLPKPRKLFLYPSSQFLHKRSAT